MNVKATRPLRALIVCSMVLLAQHAEATSITVFFGDADGFGIGATTTLSPLVSHAEPGEAEDTDVRLIGDPFAATADGFEPTGSFDAFVIPLGETIVSAMLTMSAGAWDVGAAPVDGVGTNQILLDGLAIPTTFFAMFTANNASESIGGNAIETRNILLPISFFALLADGSVSLNGTNLSEQQGSGSFQIDFLRLDIETQQVPEPATMLLLGIGLVGMARRYRTRRA